MAKKAVEKKKKVTGPRIKPKKNKQGKINYQIIGRNGKVLADVRQGFERKAGMMNNINALQKFFTSSFTIMDIE